MKPLFFLLLLIPVFVQCQAVKDGNSHSGEIQWVQNMNWEQIKAKAKAENKFIFVDCYATWCKPCKVMDKNVFTNDTATSLVNEKFIAVKVQVDTTKNDNESVRKLYPAARQFETSYQMTGVPTHLFFSPEGQIVHKETGGKDVPEFIRMTDDAIDPNEQIFTLIRKARDGGMDYNLMPVFIKRINERGDKKVALELARMYMKNYLENLPHERFANKIYLDFIVTYQKMLTTTDRFFDLCYTKSREADHILGSKGMSNQLIRSIIYNEMVRPVTNSAKEAMREPDWSLLQKNIWNKIGKQRTEEIIIEAQMAWYGANKDWVKYAHYLFLNTSRLDLDIFPSKDSRVLHLNQAAWNMFKYSANKKHLEKALDWINVAITLYEETRPPSGTLLDTKANLYYKLGKIEEAISLEEKVVELLPKSKSFQITLERMKARVPTWPAIE